MKNNLLSLGQLLEKGYIIHMNDCCLCIKDQKKTLIAKVQMTKNWMFLLNVQVDNVMCLNANIKDSFGLWHMRYGHLNFGDLKLLSKQQLVKGLPFIDHPKQL